MGVVRLATFNQLNSKVMNNYPIKNEKYGILKSFYSRRRLPILPWGEKIYLLRGEGLMACRPLYVAAARTQAEFPHTGQYHTLIGLDVAGQGIRLFSTNEYGGLSNYSDPKTGASTVRVDGFHFFHSPEQYEAYLNGDAGAEMRFPSVSIYDIIGVEFGHILDDGGEYTEPIQWRYDKGSGLAVRTGCPVKHLWIDEDGSHLELCEEKQDYRGIVKLYPSAEACIAANRAKVIEFDNEKEAPKEQEWLVDLPKTVAVTARTEEEAKEKVREGLNSILK